MVVTPLTTEALTATFSIRCNINDSTQKLSTSSDDMKTYIPQTKFAILDFDMSNSTNVSIYYNNRSYPMDNGDGDFGTWGEYVASDGE